MVRLKLACEATLLRILRSALQVADGEVNCSPGDAYVSLQFDGLHSTRLHDLIRRRYAIYLLMTWHDTLIDGLQIIEFDGLHSNLTACTQNRRM